jgi:hypothetical protein
LAGLAWSLNCASSKMPPTPGVPHDIYISTSPHELSRFLLYHSSNAPETWYLSNVAYARRALGVTELAGQGLGKAVSIHFVHLSRHRLYERSTI